MSGLLASFAAARRDHPWIVPGVLLSASAALGVALPDLVALARAVLS